MPCVEKFQESLIKFEADQTLIDRINEGSEGLVSKSPKKRKAAYFQHAIDLMTAQMEPEKMQEILEWNACCKGGAREKASRAFAKEFAQAPLAEKLDNIKNVPNMGRPILNDDGTITVHAVYFQNGDGYQCACSNFSHLREAVEVSRNYCFCCAGHFRHHYEIMLGVSLKTLEIISSPLDSQGKNPCVMRFAIV